MTDRKPASPAKRVIVRKTWTAPRVDRIDAGQAEVGTRAAADGAFSTS